MSEIHSTRLQFRDRYQTNQLTGIARLCDWFVYTKGVAKNIDARSNEESNEGSNKESNEESNEGSNEESNEESNEGGENSEGYRHPRTIFVTSYRAHTTFPYFVDDVLPQIRKPVVIVIGSGDCTFPTNSHEARMSAYKDNLERTRTMLANKLVKRVFVENLDDPTFSDKLLPLPLGILPFDKGGATTTDGCVRKSDFASRSHDIFLCHRVREGKQWETRHRVTRWFKNHPLVTHKSSVGRAEFVAKLKDSRFCICTHGGGIDPSPRCWESIMYGCIPIIEKSPLSSVYECLPVVIVDEWTSDMFTREQLDEWMEQYGSFYEDADERQKVLQLLTLQHWWTRYILPEASSEKQKLEIKKKNDGIDQHC